MIYYKIVSRTKFILIGFVFVNPDVTAHGRIFMYRSIFFQVHLEVIPKESLEEKVDEIAWEFTYFNLSGSMVWEGRIFVS